MITLPVAWLIVALLTMLATICISMVELAAAWRQLERERAEQSERYAWDDAVLTRSPLNELESFRYRNELPSAFES